MQLQQILKYEKKALRTVSCPHVWNLNDIDKFLENNGLPKQTPEEIENLNDLISIIVIKSVIKRGKHQLRQFHLWNEIVKELILILDFSKD